MTYNPQKALELVKLLDLVEPLITSGPQITERPKVEVQKRGEDYILRVDGFYKHGGVEISVSEQSTALGGGPAFVVNVQGRYGKLDTLYDPKFSDLVSLNYSEWLAWRDRGFEINTAWLPFLLEGGYVKTQTKTTYVPN